MPEEGNRAAAPPYRGEGPHAMWHFSEDPNIKRFAPHFPTSSPQPEAFVWAVDTRHAPMFWFPRDCPRGTAWPGHDTTPEDRERFFGHTDSGRLHVIEGAWLERIRNVELFVYELPSEPFERFSVGGYWVSRETVEPLSCRPAGDLLALHAEAGIELRIVPSIWPWWAAVIRSTLEFSGSRLGHATIPQPAWVTAGTKFEQVS